MTTVPPFEVRRSRYQPTADRHLYLEVVAPTPRVDLADPQMRRTSATLAGVLSRLALAVVFDVQCSARDCGCKWSPLHWPEDDGLEIRPADFEIGVCGVHLVDDAEQRAEGLLPYLSVVIPRNRERAWTRRLTEEIQALHALDTEPLPPRHEDD